MTKAIFSVPNITCETVKTYGPESPERLEVQKEYDQMMKKVLNLPMIINGKKLLLLIKNQYLLPIITNIL